MTMLLDLLAYSSTPSRQLQPISPERIEIAALDEVGHRPRHVVADELSEATVVLGAAGRVRGASAPSAGGIRQGRSGAESGIKAPDFTAAQGDPAAAVRRLAEEGRTVT